MKNKNDYLKQLNKRIFWDLNIDKLDYEYNKQTIIERIAVYGTENDEKVMNILYPLRTIKKILIKSDSINEKVIQYFSLILNIKEKKFKCYSKILINKNKEIMYVAIMD